MDHPLIGTFAAGPRVDKSSADKATVKRRMSLDSAALTTRILSQRGICWEQLNRKHRQFLPKKATGSRYDGHVSASATVSFS